jgi:hypothetical protein
MKYEDVCTKRTYEKDGQEKTVWLKCGTLRTNDNGNKFLELNHLPNVVFYVFEPKAKTTEGEAF